MSAILSVIAFDTQMASTTTCPCAICTVLSISSITYLVPHNSTRTWQTRRQAYRAKTKEATIGHQSTAQETRASRAKQRTPHARCLSVFLQRYDTNSTSRQTNNDSFIMYHEPEQVIQKTQALLQSANHHDGAWPCRSVIGSVVDKMPISTDTLEEIMFLLFCLCPRCRRFATFIGDIWRFERRKC